MTTTTRARPPRVLAICSGGGHWVQMLRLRPAFAGAEIHYACPDAGAAAQVAPAPFHVFPDANRTQPLRLVRTAIAIARLLRRVRPDAIVTTGAAGGSLAILIGRLLGIRGLFVDSIANAERLSVSARISLRVADAVLTQWPAVARRTGARLGGSVLGSGG